MIKMGTNGEEPPSSDSGLIGVAVSTARLPAASSAFPAC